MFGELLEDDVHTARPLPDGGGMRWVALCTMIHWYSLHSSQRKTQTQSVNTEASDRTHLIEKKALMLQT